MVGDESGWNTEVGDFAKSSFVLLVINWSHLMILFAWPRFTFDSISGNIFHSKVRPSSVLNTSSRNRTSDAYLFCYCMRWGKPKSSFVYCGFSPSSFMALITNSSGESSKYSSWVVVSIAMLSIRSTMTSHRSWLPVTGVQDSQENTKLSASKRIYLKYTQILYLGLRQ